MAVPQKGEPDMKFGDIVQVSPSVELFGGCLAVVAEIRDNGRILAYVPVPRESGGLAYIFLQPDKYELTGGRAQWVPKDEQDA